MSARGDSRAARLLAELGDIRHRYGAEQTERKLALLAALDRCRYPTVRSLSALHEHLLFLRAFPDDERVAQAAVERLERFEQRWHQLSRDRRAELNDSGMVGSVSSHTFSWPIVRWLIERFPREVTLDWPSLEREAALDALVTPLLARAERDAYDSGEIGLREWLRHAAREHGISELNWLVRAIAARSSPLLPHFYEQAEIPVVWRLTRSRGSATHAVLERPAPVYRTDGMRSRPDDPRRLIATPLRRIVCLPPERAREVIHVAQAALTARCREVHAIAWANAEELHLADLGAGVELAIIGAEPAQRMSLESNYGYLLFANGVPIGYGGVTPLFRQANTGINIFEAFRGSEAPFLWTQMLRAFRTLFRVNRFIVNPYQLGEGNREAIESGAFWFYYRLGFRPVAPETAEIAAREWRRLERERGSRTARAIMAELVRGDLHLTLPGARESEFFDERWLIDLSLRTTTLIERAAPWQADRGTATFARHLRGALGIQDWGRWPRSQREAFLHLAPIVSLIEDLERWPQAERQALIGILRAKGAPQELAFVHACQRHPRFIRALMARLRNRKAAAAPPVQRL